jgi:hypothetical protein
MADIDIAFSRFLLHEGIKTLMLIRLTHTNAETY